MKKILLALFLCIISFSFAHEAPVFEATDEKEECAFPLSDATFLSWYKYRANFGMEKIFIRFPNRPVIAQTSTILTAYAYENQALYSFTGYYPPIGRIDPLAFFDQTLYDISQPPCIVLNYTIYQVSNGDWVFDYVMHDTFKDLIVKNRTVVTPYNAYTLQTVIPYGYKNYFEYFLETFKIQCECEM
jgi:hypothetical protein